MKLSTSTPLPIAIIGMGSIFPDATGLKRFWQLIRTSHDAIRPLPANYWQASDYLVSAADRPEGFDTVTAATGGCLEEIDFDPTAFGIPPTVLEAIDTAQLLALMVANDALKDAGYDKDGKSFDRTRTSVITGATGAQELTVTLGARLQHPRWRKAMVEAGIKPEVADEVARRITDEFTPWQENSFPGLLGNVIAGRIANRLDLHGTNCSVDAACASSLSAIHLAILELQAGRADMVLAGGADTFNDIFMFMCFSQSHALSSSQQIKPFAADCDGTILGEGVGMIVLKRLDDAKRDKDNIYAIIRGMGTSSDGKNLSIYAPSAAGQEACLRDAYEQAGVSPHDITMIEAHGTGTKVGDAAEFQGLMNIFSQDKTKSNAPWCAVGTIKSQIGHCKAAAGIASLIKVALALHHKVLPATIKLDRPNPALDFEHGPLYANTVTRPWFTKDAAPRIAGVSSFGFGGSNFHTVLAEANPQKTADAWDGSVQLFAFSAATHATLTAQVDAFVNGMPDDLRGDRLDWAAQTTRKQFSIKDKCRFLVIYLSTEKQSVRECLAAAAAKLHANTAKSWQTDDLYYSENAAPGKLAVLFPGQGSQYTNMAKDLVCLFPECFDTLDKAAIPAENLKVSDLVYPRPTFEKQTATENEQRLSHTQYTQPALAAINLAYWKALRRFGVAPDCLAGHSFGELSALCAAGAIGEDDLLTLAAERGRLMSQSADGQGAMLAVQAPLETIDKIIVDEHFDLVLANRNSPTQGVLSGKVNAIEAAEKVLAKAGIPCKRLNVSGAFHSSFMQKAHNAFAKILKTIDFASPREAVYANATATPYPANATQERDILANQLISPVRFVELIHNMANDGVTTFIECGPKTILTKLVNACLKDTPHTCIAADASAGRKSGISDLARLIAHLAALGHDVDLNKWELPVAEPEKLRMTIKLTGKNYRAPQKQKKEYKPIAEFVTPAPQATVSAATHQTFDSIKQIQDLTADAHRKFLETQEQIQNTLQMLLQPGQPLPNRPAQEVPKSPQSAPHAENTIKRAAAKEVVKETVQTVKTAAGNVIDTILDIVAKLTGYPKEAIDLDMDMEADLGIDSIKRVEILSAIQKRIPGLPQVSSATLATLKTLREVADLFKIDTNVAQTAAPSPVKTVVSTVAEASSKMIDTMMDIVATLTGYPKDAIDLDMDMEADLGIDSIKRVEILSAIQKRIPGLPQVSNAALSSLKTLREVAEQFKITPSKTTPEAQTTPEDEPTRKPAAGTPPHDDIIATMKDVVANLTGYPKDTLDLDMDMEADLGIDSIKRVEILSTIQKRIPGLPQVSSTTLASLKTLQEVVDVFSSSQDNAKPKATLSPAAQTVQVVTDIASTATASAQKIATDLFDIVASLTGYPKSMLDPSMDLETDLGIDSIKRVEIMSALQKRVPGLPQMSNAVMSSLHTIQEIIDQVTKGVVEATKPDTTKKTTTFAPIKPLARRVPVIEKLTAEVAPSAKALTGTVVVYCPDKKDANALATELMSAGSKAIAIDGPDMAIDTPETEIDGLVILAPRGDTQFPPDIAFLKNAFLVTKRFAAALNDAGTKGKRALYATVSCLGGHFALDGALTGNAAQGGLAGMAKTAAIEWPDIVCRAIDCAPDTSMERIADELTADGPIEVGLTETERFGITLKEIPIESTLTNPIAKDEWLIVSGGGRGVSVPCVKQLAKQTGCNLLLLGRSPYSPTEPAWLKGLTAQADINTAIMNNLFTDRKATPAEIRSESKKVMTRREIAATLNHLLEEGICAEYLSLNVLDKGALKQNLQAMRDDGRVFAGIVHAAGVIEDKLIIDKTVEQFDRVLRTKVDGLQSLLECTAEDDLKLIALFSSVSARFGNRGQIDYSCANETMNKMAQHLAATRNNCRVVSINWGPWESGMVTPQLRKHFESKGISVIKLDEGAAAFLREVCQPARKASVEVVLGHGFEAIAQPKVASATAPTAALTKFYSQTITDTAWPFLTSHMLAGKEVLPLAMSLELMAHAAMLNNPGLTFHGVEDLRVMKGVIVDEKQTVTLDVLGCASVKQDGLFRCTTETRVEGANTPNARGVVLLTESYASALPEAPKLIDADLAAVVMTGEDVYRDILFHGKQLQGIVTICSITDNGLTLIATASPKPSAWMTSPLRPIWLTDPLSVDVALQAGIVWAARKKHMPGLPTAIASVTRYTSTTPGTSTVHVFECTSNEPNHIVGNITIYERTSLKAIMKLTDVEWTVDASLAQAYGKDIR